MAEEPPHHIVYLNRRERWIFLAFVAVLLCALGVRWAVKSGWVWPRTDIAQFAENARHPIDLNRASAGELCWLPDVGPKTARAIVADRSARGPFINLEDLARVHNIGPGLIETIRPFVVVGPPAEPEGEAAESMERSEE